MPAKFTIIKFTGKDSDFGTEVSSLGIKRVDAAVPAVYGVPVVPGNDNSDVSLYSIYRPDDPSGVNYSFETVFKLKMELPPSNQLSNIRIYPKGSAPTDPKACKCYIGSKTGYSRPTNTKSIVAVNDIWNFSKESPFKITVGGISGTALDPQVAIGIFNVSLHDIGNGNVIYLNNERQDTMQLVLPRVGHPDRVYTIVDRTGGQVSIKIFNPLDNTLVIHPDIVTSIDGNGRTIVTITASSSLSLAFPNGLLYGSQLSVAVGGIMEWIDIDGDVISTEVHDVVVREMNGIPAFYIDEIRTPVLNFDLNHKYVFNNHSGDTHPMRFTRDQYATVAVESNIVLSGITVQNGGTVDEIIVIDPLEVRDGGDLIQSYQSTRATKVGSGITNLETSYKGAYNINTIGGGINPLAAGETDYIYVQIEVKADSSVGSAMPELAIVYDEN